MCIVRQANTPRGRMLQFGLHNLVCDITSESLNENNAFTRGGGACLQDIGEQGVPKRTPAGRFILRRFRLKGLSRDCIQISSDVCCGRTELNIIIC